MSADAVGLEVVKNSLLSIAEEMGAVLIRAAYSTNIKDRRDCSCAIYTKAGDLAAQAEHIPLHLGIMPSAVKAILGYCEEVSMDLKPGDMLLCNDPFLTGSHTWDLMVVAPVFLEGEIAAIVGNLAHQADIGEHKSHVASEALDEGIRVPPVKLVKEGVLDNEILSLVERTLTYGALVHGGILDRFPKLKICMLHGGGYVAFGIARMDKGWEAARLDYMAEYSAGEDADQELSKPPSSYLGSFYYDCATFSEQTLRFLIDTVGIDRVVFGTDYPCPMEIVDAVNWVNGLESLTENEKEAILSKNPAQMLSI